jgi:hypothetical protein
VERCLPLPVARLLPVFVERSSFADAVFAGHQERRVGINDLDADHVVAFLRPDPPDAGRAAAHVASFFFVEPDAHAVFGDEDDFVVAVGEFDADEPVAALNGDAEAESDGAESDDTTRDVPRWQTPLSCAANAAFAVVITALPVGLLAQST